MLHSSSYMGYRNCPINCLEKRRKMYVISISHKIATVEIRERFSFSKEEQEEFLRLVMDQGHYEECVILSTCNRCEVYFTPSLANAGFEAVQEMEKLLTEFKKTELSLLLKYFLVYNEEKAIQHLFSVTCGMDSMVIGEDEILGQVKDAYNRALNLKATKYMLNTLFQAAITCAKKIKTDTRLSKTPVSIGTLAANEVFRFGGDIKRVLIIGMTGKMGTIIMKNLYGKENIQITGTSRNHNSIEIINREYRNLRMIEFKERYEYIDEADIVISATTSPHYTITCKELSESIRTRKERLFLDLSVPLDIDREITKLDGVTLHDIDFYQQISRQNIELKEQETIRAAQMIEEHLDNAKKEVIFHSFLPDLPDIGNALEKIRPANLIYELKDRANSEELSVMLQLVRKLL